MINRHKTKWGIEYFLRCIKMFEERLELYKNRVENNLNLSFKSVSNNLTEVAWYKIMASQPNPEIIKYLQYSLDFGIAHFQKTMNDGKQITINLNGEEFQITGKFTTDGIDLGSWIYLFEKATILRNKEALQFLAEIPHEFMMQNELSHDDYIEAQYFYYKNIINQNEEQIKISFERLKIVQFEPKYIVAGRGLNQERSMEYVKEERLYVVQKELFPICELFYTILTSPDDFNAMLLNSIQLFKKTIEKDKGQDAWPNWISRSHLAVCAFAHDHGINITVESDYIPKWLYEGNWEEEV